MPGCWPSTGPANQPKGGKGGRSPLLRFLGGGRGFWASFLGPKGPHTRSVFRARGLYTIKKRLADLGRSDKYLKRLEFCGILAGGAWFVSRACVVRIPCLRGSYPVPAWFVSRACVVRIPCLRGSYPVPAWFVSRAYFRRRLGGLRAAKCFCWLLLGTVRTCTRSPRISNAATAPTVTSSLSASARFFLK